MHKLVYYLNCTLLNKTPQKMNKLITIALFLISAQIGLAQTTATKIVNMFLLPEKGEVFRGYDFYTLEDDINDAESKISSSEYSFDEIDDDLNMLLGYDINFDEKNYAFIDYSLDLEGIYDIYSDIYLESEKMAREVYNELKKYYDKKLGNSSVDGDGWIIYKGLHEGLDNYTVTFKQLKDGDTNYIGFDIYLN